MRNLSWYIARHYLRGGRRGGFLSLITWISLGGVTVGVTALIVVIAVMSGMQEDLRNKILESTPHLHVLETGTALRMENWRRVLDSVRAVDGVVAAAPFVLTKVMVTRTGASGDYAQTADLFGISMDAEGTPSTEMERRMREGALNLETPESGLPPLLMGRGLADRMIVFPGDTLVLFSFENIRQGFGGLTPTLRQFEVTGTFETGMYDYDMQNVYTTLEAAQDLVGIAAADQVGGIGVQVTDPELAPRIAADVQERVGFGYVVQSWIQTNQALFSALKLEKLAMQLILFLIVLVAAFNIVSTLVMVVSDRTREIGILKAMGMTRRGILRVFVLQGAWIGVMGTTIGTVLGVFLCWLLQTYDIIRIPPEVYFVDHLPVSLELLDVAVVVVASVSIAFLATAYPSRLAARLEPVEAIRHD